MIKISNLSVGEVNFQPTSFLRLIKNPYLKSMLASITHHHIHRIQSQ